MLDHGGGVLAASRRYNIPVSDWLDLSTGLNPCGWPVPPISPKAWLRLPEQDDGLEAAAADYYGSPLLLPVAGSQPAIQALPRLRRACTVGLLTTSYAEHAHAWQQQGHTVVTVEPDQLETASQTLDALVLCHPNNPTGWQTSTPELLRWRSQLAERGGWLIVDEAFIDCQMEHSLIPFIGSPGLIVLRSIGKFFGLAGARAGFVFAWPALLQQLQEELGPWTLSGPTREITQQALRDKSWQQAARQRLQQDSLRLAVLLSRFHLAPAAGTPLFQWIKQDNAQQWHIALAQQGILTRYFARPCSLRFGLPANENDWERLEDALGRLARDMA